MAIDESLLGFPVIGWFAKKQPARKMLCGNYCKLEPLELAKHSNELYQEFKRDHSDDIWKYLPFGPFHSFDEFKNWLTNDSKYKVFFVIVDNINSTLKGLASFHDIDQVHGVIEIGSIIFSKSLQKTRCATEAMYLMMKHVFDDLGFRRYQWRCNSLNKASRKAAERLGFKFEGIFRQAHVFKGRNRDTAWYSIIDSEWPTLKLKFEKWLETNNFKSDGSQITRLQDF